MQLSFSSCGPPRLPADKPLPPPRWARTGVDGGRGMYGRGCSHSQTSSFLYFWGGGAGRGGKGVTTKESSKVMSVQRLGILF